MKTVLKAKISEIKITGANHNYEGSLTLDTDIMEKLNIVEGEQIFINSKYGEGRIMTYILPGKRGSDICELNGGACNHFEVGEIVHLLFFTQINDWEKYSPIIIK